MTSSIINIKSISTYPNYLIITSLPFIVGDNVILEHLRVKLMIEINYLDVNEWLVKIEIDQKLTKIED